MDADTPRADAMGAPLRTPLTDWHEQHGAKMAEFGGYWMPIEYTGIMREHQAVRREVGIFDVSHMAEFWVTGDGAALYLDRLVTNWPSALPVGHALYTPMCYPDGGTVDDLLVLRMGDERFLLVTNAANHDSDAEWLSSNNLWPARVQIADVSSRMGLIAVQGPQAADLMDSLADRRVSDLASFGVREGVQVAGASVIVSRTGYTGEDGFELYMAEEEGEGSGVSTRAVWQALAAAGASPVGLGARDTLRLEARLPLYGHELGPDITPLEAGIGIFVKWDKPVAFVGREALARQRENGLTRRLVGLRVDGGIARAGYVVRNAQDPGGDAGRVTSGTHSPTLAVPVALALVPVGWAKVGTELTVEIRSRSVPAKVVRLPFYRREAV
ncbi:MAG: glycine cleavage system aminomethyltransferase GcvT [Clostridia bacterium]